MPKNPHMMTRAQMEAEIDSGRSVLHNGIIITNKAHLPSDIELTSDDPEARQAAAAAIDEQIKRLQASKDTLLSGKGSFEGREEVARKQPGAPELPPHQQVMAEAGREGPWVGRPRRDADDNPSQGGSGDGGRRAEGQHHGDDKEAGHPAAGSSGQQHPPGQGESSTRSLPPTPQAPPPGTTPPPGAAPQGAKPADEAKSETQKDKGRSDRK